MKPVPKPDITGQIDYDFDQKLVKLVFWEKPTKRIYTIKRDGIPITSRSLRSNMYKFAKELGYEITYETVSTPNSHVPKPNISVPCTKKCYYEKEKFHGECKLGIQAHVVVERDKGKIISQKIEVNFGANDIKELNQKCDCIIDLIREKTGLVGKPIIYTRQERC